MFFSSKQHRKGNDDTIFSFVFVLYSIATAFTKEFTQRKKGFLEKLERQL